MKRLFAIFLFLGAASFLFAGGLWAQALTLGTVSMTGEVKVSGPGGMMYTGTDGSAPLFPGSTVEVGKGQALVDLAGKGTITASQGSRLVFHGEVPYFEKGAFQVRLMPGESMVFHTPQGMVTAKAGEGPTVFSLVAEGGKTKVSLMSGNLVLKAHGASFVYKLEGGKYLLQGKELAFAGKGEFFMASKEAMAGMAAAGAGAGMGTALAEVGAGMVPVAMGLSGVAAATMVVGARQAAHHGPTRVRMASPYTP